MPPFPKNIREAFSKNLVLTQEKGSYEFMKNCSIKTLPQEFYQRPTLQVAKELLGKTLVFGEHRGRITETEAYIGENDPACHAARGMTPRTQVMFGQAGYSYVYIIYGMYHCLNFVTENEDFPAAVLIRGVHLLSPPYTYLDGPGKLCRHFGITRHHNKLNIVKSNDFYVEDTPLTPQYHTTPRIGIKVGLEHLWRFIDRDYVDFKKNSSQKRSF